LSTYTFVSHSRTRAPPYLMGMGLAIVWFYYFRSSSQVGAGSHTSSTHHCMRSPHKTLRPAYHIDTAACDKPLLTDLPRRGTHLPSLHPTQSNPTPLAARVRSSRIVVAALELFALFLFAITVWGGIGAYEDTPPEWSVCIPSPAEQPIHGHDPRMSRRRCACSPAAMMMHSWT
jgi:hypothetical protein